VLAPHLDATFDRGFITVADDGAIVVSDALDDTARSMASTSNCMCVA
jgi:hypothetical protein